MPFLETAEQQTELSWKTCHLSTFTIILSNIVNPNGDLQQFFNNYFITNASEFIAHAAAPISCHRT